MNDDEPVELYRCVECDEEFESYDAALECALDLQLRKEGLLQ